MRIVYASEGLRRATAPRDLVPLLDAEERTEMARPVGASRRAIVVEGVLTMRVYIVRRLLLMVPVLILVSMIAFSIILLLPGDPALAILGPERARDTVAYQALRQELGLDRPIPVQYLSWVSKMLVGDFGNSAHYQQPVTLLIGQSIGPTVQLAVHGDADRAADRDPDRDHLGRAARLVARRHRHHLRALGRGHPELPARDLDDPAVRAGAAGAAGLAATCRSPRTRSSRSG